MYNDLMPLEVRQSIEDLIRLATKHKMIVAGFAFGSEPPCMTNFGNCSDMGDIELYAELCSIADGKRRQGLSINNPIGRIQ